LQASDERFEEHYKVQTVSKTLTKKKLIKNAFGVYKPTNN